MITFLTAHCSPTSAVSAPTASVPDGCPKRTRPSAPTAATRCTRVPGIAAAAAIATAPVPVIAWCSCPIEKIRASRSIDEAATNLPSEAAYVAGLATNASFGVCGRVAVASSGLATKPIATAP